MRKGPSWRQRLFIVRSLFPVVKLSVELHVNFRVPEVMTELMRGNYTLPVHQRNDLKLMSLYPSSTLPFC